MKARSIVPLFVPVVLLVGCGEPPPPATPPPPEPPAATATPAMTAAPAETAAPAATTAPTAEAPKLPPFEIRPMAPPPAPEKMPSVTITAPKAGESIKPDKVADYQVKVEAKDWPIEQKGPHIHLILDNQPYKALFEARSATKLSDIAPNASLGEGQHLLVAFPSRMNHLSVKPDGKKNPLVVVPFTIGKAGKDGFKKSDPLLIYSRPKGAYNGADASEILLDFYLSNVELGDKKNSVRATVTPSTGEAKTITITTWQPYTLVNLPNGDTKVKLELLDKDGKAVPGAWNTTERTITVNRDAK